ncbi:MAG: TerY-C metal binding domain-containing protein [Bacteroidota bacterium]
MRRLPIFFLIDVSDSMVGEPLDQVQKGLELVVKELRSDPYALETAYISVLAFASKAVKISNLTEVFQFYPPRLPLGSGTGLGAGLTLLMNEIDANVKTNTHTVKGDWKPIVFLFTDGAPTDHFKPAVQRWKDSYTQKANLVVVGFGPEVDLSAFSGLTENIFAFDDSDPKAFSRFFKWISQSIQNSSQRVETGTGDALQLAGLNADFLVKKPVTEEIMPYRAGISDNRYVILEGRCQKNKNGYLLKYKREMRKTDERVSEFGISTQEYVFKGAYLTPPEYTELSVNAKGTGKVNTDELVGIPPCPSCGNFTSFCLCSCGKLHCANEGINRCPWCESQSEVEFRGSIDVGRNAG